jgi:hypothetical protein
VCVPIIENVVEAVPDKVLSAVPVTSLERVGVLELRVGVRTVDVEVKVNVGMDIVMVEVGVHFEVSVLDVVGVGGDSDLDEEMEAEDGREIVDEEDVVGVNECVETVWEWGDGVVDFDGEGLGVNELLALGEGEFVTEFEMVSAGDRLHDGIREWLWVEVWVKDWVKVELPLKVGVALRLVVCVEVGEAEPDRRHV